MNAQPIRPEAKPFLRWAGSKRKLLPKLVPYWNPSFNRYIEPFAGSSTLFFALRPSTAVLSDINDDLIQALQMVRDDPCAVYEAARKIPLGRRSYYRLRALEASELKSAKRAARFIFLNRFCFNGLYRTNERGQFNVPFSPQRTGSLPSRDALKTAGSLLKRAKIQRGDFERIVLKTVRRGDFVYLDPPFALGNRRVFRQYGANCFGLDDLARLRKLLVEIDRRGAHFVLSYADCHEARDTFRKWPFRRVLAQRNISGFARHRRRAAELVYSNLDHPG